MFHFSKEVSRTHGVPFRFIVKPVRLLAVSCDLREFITGVLQGEKFHDTKKRLQARIGVSDKDFAKYRFALIQVATFKQPSYIEDGESSLLDEDHSTHHVYQLIPLGSFSSLFRNSSSTNLPWPW